ncbi:MAG: methionine biosynthesis protein MetW [Verrucomicrobiota bacterium]
MTNYEANKQRIQSAQQYPEKPVNRRLQIIVDAIPPGSRVLDVACGTGRVLQGVLAKDCSGRGIDLSLPATHAAREKGLDIVQGDVDAYEREAAVRELLFARYDVVIFSKCLMYLTCDNRSPNGLPSRSGLKSALQSSRHVIGISQLHRSGLERV